jgi:hypothetical protein
VITPTHLAEAEEFRAKHGLHPAIPVEEISQAMSLAELGLLPTICPPCHAREHDCWHRGCECKECA